MRDAFYILSVDGGGFRGLFSAHLLKRMEEEWKLDWHARFGMFAGTSTGSILTAGLACGLSAAELAQFYKTHGKALFTPRFRSRFDPLKIFTSRYSSKTLRVLLEKELGNTTLGEVSVPLIWWLLSTPIIGWACHWIGYESSPSGPGRARPSTLAKPAGGQTGSYAVGRAGGSQRGGSEASCST